VDARSLAVLLIGGDAAQRAATSRVLETRGYSPRVAPTAAEGTKLLRDEGADVAIVLLPLDDAPSTTLLQQIQAHDAHLPIVVAGRDGGIRGALAAIEHGAREYVGDPTNADEVLSVLSIVLGARRSDAQLRWLRSKDAAGAEWQSLIGECPAMREVFAFVRHLCHRTAGGGTPAVLITGETGTGKGMLAKAIHYHSIRRSRMLVDVNCAAIPPTLIESEMFGHERGAFTDARASRQGLFELADGGTLFLDEVSALSLELQAKLLTVIEEKQLRRLGGTRTIRVDVQVIAASNRDLGAMVRRGELRADLYHRLNVLAVNLPALRERGGDAVLIAEAFIRETCRSYGIPCRPLSDAAKHEIARYSWPGNVRELRNRLERVLLLRDEDVITPEHLGLGGRAEPGMRVDRRDAELRVTLPDEGFSLEQVEREILRQALTRHEGNVSAAARYLGITRHTLMYRIKKHGLDTPAPDPGPLEKNIR
jgi:DNA-binding NtrC family response regulator